MFTYRVKESKQKKKNLKDSGRLISVAKELLKEQMLAATAWVISVMEEMDVKDRTAKIYCLYEGQISYLQDEYG